MSVAMSKELIKNIHKELNDWYEESGKRIESEVSRKSVAEVLIHEALAVVGAATDENVEAVLELWNEKAVDDQIMTDDAKVMVHKAAVVSWKSEFDGPNEAARAGVGSQTFDVTDLFTQEELESGTCSKQKQRIVNGLTHFKLEGLLMGEGGKSLAVAAMAQDMEYTSGLIFYAEAEDE